MYRFRIICTKGKNKGQKVLIMGRAIDFSKQKQQDYRCRRRQILRAESIAPKPERWKTCFVLLYVVTPHLAYYDGKPYPWEKNEE